MESEDREERQPEEPHPDEPRGVGETASEQISEDDQADDPLPPPESTPNGDD